MLCPKWTRTILLLLWIYWLVRRKNENAILESSSLRLAKPNEAIQQRQAYPTKEPRHYRQNRRYKTSRTTANPKGIPKPKSMTSYTKSQRKARGYDKYQKKYESLRGKPQPSWLNQFVGSLPYQQICESLNIRYEALQTVRPPQTKTPQTTNSPRCL